MVGGTLATGDATAQVESVENSRHFVMYDQPQALDSLLVRFLSSLHR
jgi:pimeloyl-ACP methyl ester carboxylesterase